MQNFGGGKKQKLLNKFSSPSATLSTDSRDGTWKHLRTFWEKYFGDSWILIKRVLPFWKLSGILLRQMEKHCREIRSPWLLHKPAERNFLSLRRLKREEGESNRTSAYSWKSRSGSLDQEQIPTDFSFEYDFLCVCSFEDCLSYVCCFCLPNSKTKTKHENTGVGWK